MPIASLNFLKKNWRKFYFSQFIKNYRENRKNSSDKKIISSFTFSLLLSLESVTKIDPDTQARINARHEIERRNELKALRSELDEWDDLDEEDL